MLVSGSISLEKDGGGGNVEHLSTVNELMPTEIGPQISNLNVENAQIRSFQNLNEHELLIPMPFFFRFYVTTNRADSMTAITKLQCFASVCFWGGTRT